jgi:RimJ/RimL family protein N-acetyltransferase
LFETDLNDGTRVLVRAVTPADRVHLLEGFEHLSQRSRFFRFLSAISRLSEEDLERFTSPGDDSRQAFGALDVTQAVPVPMAIVRYERLAPEEAEMAVTVTDRYQGKGVGTLMIGTAACCAARAGIRRFVAFVHPQNVGMAGLMTALGASLVDAGDYENRFEMPVHADPALYPANRQGDGMRRAYRLIADATA